MGFFSNSLPQASTQSGSDDLATKVLETADAVLDVAQLAAQITQKPNPFQLGLIGLSAVRASMRLRTIWSRLPSWTQLYPGAWSGDAAIREVLLPVLGPERAVTRVSDGHVAYWEVDGARFALQWSGDRRTDGNFWYDSDGWEAVAALMARVYRETHTAPLYGWSDSRFVAEVPLVGLVEPEQLSALLTRVRGFFEAGKHRTYMLTGAPGTGKGALSYLIARTLNATLVSIDAANLRDTSAPSHGERDMTSPVAQIGVWKPLVVVVNDIDYLQEYEQLEVLSHLERLHRAARLVFVTVNHPNNLCAAAKRPGRMDEVFEVEGVGEHEAAALLPNCTPAQRFLVEGWPIAYVAELAARLEQYGVDQFDAEHAQLQARVTVQEVAEEEANEHEEAIARS